MTEVKRFTLLSTVLILFLWVRPVYAETLEFDFKDPKGVNSVYFLLDSKLEPIMGLASGISGTVKFDPAAPERTSGKLVVQAKSLSIENEKMTEVLHAAGWMNAVKYPEIEFAFKEVKSSGQAKDNVFDLTVVGDFICRGITKELTVPVKASYLPGRLGERLRGKSGDLLVLRSEFTIKRSDFGIKPSASPNTVADDIQIRVSVVGTHVKE